MSATRFSTDKLLTVIDYHGSSCKVVNITRKILHVYVIYKRKGTKFFNTKCKQELENNVRWDHILQIMKKIVRESLTDNLNK